MTAPLTIRPIIEMQDYERLRHATRLPGEQIADAYLEWMQRQAVSDSAVLVAERRGSFIGFVCRLDRADAVSRRLATERYRRTWRVWLGAFAWTGWFRHPILERIQRLT